MNPRLGAIGLHIEMEHDDSGKAAICIKNLLIIVEGSTMKKKLLAMSVLAAISTQAYAFQFDTSDDW